MVPATAPSNEAVAWQNFSYAVQWFVFAGFMIFVWLRLVREDYGRTLRRDPATSTDPAPAAADLTSRSNS